ncbi:MAG: tetratricopeptide repeat protein [Alistipes sp.]|nr:tetratricopeptide repeat protein [Alistipes sp.]
MKKLFLTVVALVGATTLFAQTDIVATFQQGAANAKAGNLVEAIEQLNSVIDNYYDIEEPDANQEKAFAGAKKYIVVCYNMLGGRAYNAKDYDTAIGYFTQAADAAELYDNVSDANKNRQFVGKCYEAKGAEAFNTGDYATAIEVFSKGYAADKRNTTMALNLAESFFKSDRYQEGMQIASEIASLNPDKFGEAIAEAHAKMDMYTNNEVAKLQMANDYDGIIAMAEQLPNAAMAQKVIMQAYYGKRDFNKMIEMYEEALAAQTTDEGRSDIHYLAGVAYNEKIEGSANAEAMKNQAIAAFRQVTAGKSVESARSVVQQLTAPVK